MEPMFGASSAGSDRGAGANAGAQGNFAPKAAGFRRRCLGPSTVKWLAAGPSEQRFQGKERIATFCKYPRFSLPSVAVVMAGLVRGPSAVTAHTHHILFTSAFRTCA